MSRGRQTAIQIVDEIARLTADGYGPSQIFRDLEKRTWLGCEPVSRRTVQEIARVARGKDPTAPWSFVDTPSDDARLVLDVLSPIVRRTDGRVWFSKDLAGWVVRVRKAAPTMPPDWVHLVAHGYQWSRADDHETHALDLTLATAPWQNAQNAQDWARLLHEMGDRVGDWPGGGPGLMAHAAREFPRPEWAAREKSWQGLLWEILLGGVDAVIEEADEPEPGKDSPSIDSKVTAKPVDGGGPTETDAGENPRHHEESGPE